MSKVKKWKSEKLGKTHGLFLLLKICIIQEFFVTLHGRLRNRIPHSLKRSNHPFATSKRPVWSLQTKRDKDNDWFLFFILIYTMKSMSKSELADRAGVSVNTLMNWCKPFRQELSQMGMLPNAKVLPPRIVKFITDKFCIDVDERWLPARVLIFTKTSKTLLGSFDTTCLFCCRQESGWKTSSTSFLPTP